MITKPATLWQRRWFCPRWLFNRKRLYSRFWMKPTVVDHVHSRIQEFVRRGPLGSPLISLADGVRGITFPDADKKRIIIVMLFAEREGNGDIGRYLDSLSPEYVVMGVTSQILLGMLVRRGWIPTWEPDTMGGMVDVWVQGKTLSYPGFAKEPLPHLFSDSPVSSNEKEAELKQLARKIDKAEKDLKIQEATNKFVLKHFR